MARTSAPPAITRHVDALWDESPADLALLLEAAEQVDRTADTPGFRVVREIVQREVQMIDRKLDDGPALEQAEYAKLHGRRSGLLAFEDVVKAVRARADLRLQKSNEADDPGESGSER